VRDAVYARSYLGYGAVAMQARVHGLLLEDAARGGSGGVGTKEAGVVSNPCGFEGHEEGVEGEESAVRVLRGSGNYGGCVALLRRAFAAMQAGDGGTGAVTLPAAAAAGARPLHARSARFLPCFLACLRAQRAPHLCPHRLHRS
jgi:hypothetical protein